MGCGRCERRDELDYCNLDDREKHFLMFMVDGCRREMTVQDDFLKRFRGEIPREIKLETRNGRSYTVEVAKYPDKLVLRAGWGAFVETYDLQIDDSVVLRYNGNSQFNVVVFDRFGREKASSVVADNAPLSTYVQERHISSPGTLDRSRGHSQLSEMQSPTDNVNHSQGHAQPIHTQLQTENMRCSEGHPQPMQMLSPTANVDHFVGHSQPMEMKQPTETPNHSKYHPQSMQMQMACELAERQSNLQRDNSCQGNKTVASSSEDSLPPPDDMEVCDTPRYMLGWSTHLSEAQKKEVDQKVQHIHSDNPIFVSMMSKCNVTGTFTLSVSKQYVERYMGNKERSICLQRLGKSWEVYFGGRPTEKRIISGWRKFVKDNDVKMGDICIFELLKKCKTCTMEVQIIHAKEINSPSKIGCDRVQDKHKDATKTVDHSHSRSQLKKMQLHNETLDDSLVHPQPMQLPSRERRLLVQRDTSSKGNKRDSLSSEDIGHEIDDFPEYITARFTRLTQVQEKAVKQKVQSIDSDIPIYVVVMQKTNVTGKFNLSISNKYVEKYLGGEVPSIWLERQGQRCQVRFGRRPRDNSRIASGWAKFVKDNEVETGDICLFVPLKHRKLCTMKVHIICAKRVS